MTSAPNRSPSAVSVSRSECAAYGVKFLANSTTDHKRASRRWFVAFLWRAFPARSEADLAQKASRVLDYSPRQITNWLRCENDAPVSVVTAVLVIAGAEVVFRRIEDDT